MDLEDRTTICDDDAAQEAKIKSILSMTAEEWEAHCQQRDKQLEDAYWEDQRAKRRWRMLFYQDLAPLIEKHRTARGYTVKRTCQAVDVDINTYRNYEKGHKQIPLDIFVRLCQVLELDFCCLGTHRPDPEERQLLDHIRHKNVRAVLEWVLAEM